MFFVFGGRNYKVFTALVRLQAIRADEIITTLLCPCIVKTSKLFTYLKVTDGEGHKYKN